ncbi:MAG: hypothetical protein H6722_13350 [Sandaracinus sp.]|nr:hypothetical protein [Sandaracinus sp.]
MWRRCGSSSCNTCRPFRALTPSSASRDKLRSLQLLTAAGGSGACDGVRASHQRSRSGDRCAWARRLIVKVLEGTQGRGVLLASDARGAAAIAETLLAAGTPVLLQRFVAESRGRDVRAFVVG